MRITHSVQTCRWGTPTLSLEWPWWYDASENEWTCTRDGRMKILTDDTLCLTCPHWAPAPSEALPARPENLQDQRL